MSEKKKNEQRVENDYGAEQIEILEGLEAVRKRPGMYIGSTSAQGLHHLAKEIVDNSVDEYLAGYGDRIDVMLHKDGSLSVQDNGRGIPVDIEKKMKKPAVEVVLTVLHAGGKFNGEGSGYKTSGGLHGVGSSVVNALSSWMHARVKRDGKIHEISFEQGKKTKDLAVIGSCDKKDTGTFIHFLPDDEIFTETTDFNYDRLSEMLRECAMLNKHLTITLTDERSVINETGEYRSDTFYYERGIAQYVELLNESKTPLHEPVIFFDKEFTYTEKKKKKKKKDDPTQEFDDLNEEKGIERTVKVELAMQYTNVSANNNIYSFCNNIRTPDGGKHEEGFKRALTKVVKDYIVLHKLIKRGNKEPNGDDTRAGLTAIISVKVEDPQFEGQTKTKLGSSEALTAVNEVTFHELTRFFDENPDVASIILKKIIDACEIRVKAELVRDAEAKKRDNYGGSRTLPEKLEDCTTKNIDIKELYIVEGDSAGGSAKQGRDRLFQAILPLRGKSLNVEKHGLDKVLNNKELDAIITCIGTGTGENYNHDKRRYDKIIIMTDADVDGRHISLLMITFLYRYMRPLFEHGCVYLARPPLYKIQQGKKIEYVYSDKEKDDYLAMLSPSPRPSIQRYKGLGEMNPEQLFETTMDPKERTLSRITVDDAEAIDDLIINLMGEKVEYRKEFITENGLYAEVDA